MKGIQNIKVIKIGYWQQWNRRDPCIFKTKFIKEYNKLGKYLCFRNILYQKMPTTICK